MQKIMLFIIFILVLLISYFVLRNTENVKKSHIQTSRSSQNIVTSDLEQNNLHTVKKIQPENTTSNKIPVDTEDDKISERSEKMISTIAEYKTDISETLKVRHKVVDCLKEAHSFSAVIICTQQLTNDPNQNISDLETMSAMPTINDIPNINDDSQEWDENIKEVIINTINMSIKREEKIESCIEESSTQKEIENCYNNTI